MWARTAISVSPKLAYLLVQLFFIQLTLGWRVRKTRRAFEKELIRHGMSKRDARQLSLQIKIAKDRIMSSLWKLAR